MNGWGPKSSIRPSKPGKSNFLGGISRDFAGMSRAAPEKFEKKKFGFNFRSLPESLLGYFFITLNVSGFRASLGKIEWGVFRRGVLAIIDLSSNPTSQ